MRINFILPPDGIVGGLRVISIYAKRLAQRGHDVSVIHPLHPRITLREMWRSLKHGRGIPKSLNGGPSYFDKMELPLSKGSFRRMALDHAAPVTVADVPDGDVVIATWWETAEWVWRLPASKGAKIHFMQGYEVWNESGAGVERVNEVYRLPMPKIVIAEWMGELLRRKFGQKETAVVGNSVDPELFYASPRGKQAVPTVGFLYSIIPLKGSKLAIEAIRRAREVIPELRVVSFGSEEPLPEMPLPEGTSFMKKPPQDLLREKYSSCDAWLFASRDEGFGLPILEAMACRTPVIGTPAGAAPELIGRGGGKLVRAGDAETMAAAIVEMARLPEDDWRRMSDVAHATATGYSWEDATDKFEAALRQVAETAGVTELQGVGEM